MENKIVRLGNGWYGFKKLNQSQMYIKINALKCSSDRKAINQARMILRDKKAIVEIEYFKVFQSQQKELTEAQTVKQQGRF